MQPAWKRLKPYFQFLLLGATLIFLGIAVQRHWQGVLALKLQPAGFGYLVIAFCLTLLSHVWLGWVWSWILAVLGQRVSGIWAVQVYLKTNIAKYLPSNVLHFYARTAAAIEAGISLGTASLSVLLEPLLMVAAALIIALVSFQFDLIQALGLLSILVAVHPRILNPVTGYLARLRTRKQPQSLSGYRSRRLRRYPIIPLLGVIGFLVLRTLGFVFTVLALTTIPLTLLPTLFGVFSIGWLLGFITPGSPGGLGVLEVTVVTLLGQLDPSVSQESLSQAAILGAVALHRLITILTEAIGAGLAWLDQKFAVTGAIAPLQSLSEKE